MLSKLIKKEMHDLKSYFQELGFTHEAKKEEGVEELFVKASGIGLKIAQAPKE